MSLYQEVRLYTNASQREAFDNRAELYSIIKTIQELEVNFRPPEIHVPKPGRARANKG